MSYQYYGAQNKWLDCRYIFYYIDSKMCSQKHDKKMGFEKGAKTELSSLDLNNQENGISVY